MNWFSPKDKGPQRTARETAVWTRRGGYILDDNFRNPGENVSEFGRFEDVDIVNSSQKDQSQINITHFNSHLEGSVKETMKKQ